MPAPKKYRNTTPFLFNAELDRLNEFKAVCHKEKKSVQEKLNELIIQAVERAGIGENNPLGITYGPPVQQKISNFTNNPLEVLDHFIDNGITKVSDWQQAYLEVQDQERIDKYLNLTDSMYTAAKNRRSVIKTGRVTVRAGKVQTLPFMKGTRSGF